MWVAEELISATFLATVLTTDH